MNVCVSSEFRFSMTPDGAAWTDGACNYRYLSRMLTVFDHVKVAARVKPVEASQPNERRADGPGVGFCPLPSYLGPLDYLRRARGVTRAAAGAVGPRDAVILNVPSQIGHCLRSTLAPGRPYAVQVFGDPQDVFAPGAIRHPMRPLLHWYCPRQLRNLCREACTGLYINAQSLPARYPCPNGMTIASDVELPPEAFVSEPRTTPRHSGPMTLINIGTMAQLYKGQDLLIDALAKCLRDGLDVRLVLVGDGKHRGELEARARRLGVEDRVVFSGQLPAGEPIRAELDAADVFVFPSRAEALGRALLEAMARGLPCLGSRVGGIPELLADEDLLPVDDLSAWVGALHRMAHDHRLRERMSARNLERSLEFRTEFLQSQHTHFYRQVADRTSEWLKAGAAARATLAADLLSRALLAGEAPMIVAITGGAGFIGRRLVERHLQAGDVVRVLTRRERPEVPFASHVQLVSGDLASNEASLAPFAEGADVLYHCAGEIRRPERMKAVHVDGTRRLIAAAAGRVRRWVQLSSVGAYGRRTTGVVDELTSTRPQGEYEQTKLESDLLVEAAAGLGAFEHVVLRPSIVFGPGMSNKSLWQMISMIERRLFFFIGPPGASVNGIYVDNVVEALTRCGASASAQGRTFNLSDWRTLEDFVGSIAISLGRPAPRLRLPEPPIRLAARMLGRLPGVPLTESRVDALCNRARYPSGRIERELGYAHPVSMEFGLARLVDAWRQRN